MSAGGEQVPYITFAGAAKDGLGIALWQADGTGPEPAAVGHAFDTPIGRITSHYYIASRDYDGIDPAARGALAAQGSPRGFPRLTSALTAHDAPPSDLVIRLPLITPGSDREGTDWFYRDDVETRYLRPVGSIPLLVGGKTALHLAIERLVLREDYRGAKTFSQVRLSLSSEPFGVTRVAVADGAAAAIARALMDDINSRPLRFTADRIVLRPEEFSGRGRTRGYFADVPSARLELVLP